MAQRQPVLAELGLERGPGGAGLDTRCARDGVDLEHAVERAQVDCDGSVERGRDRRRDATDDRSAATEGDRRDALTGAPLQQTLNV